MPEITTEERSIADFSVTLLDLEEAVEELFHLGLIVEPEYVEFGLIIMNVASAAEGAFQIYPGNNRIKAYSLYLGRPGDITLEEVYKIYAEKFPGISQVESSEDPVKYFEMGIEWQKAGDFDRAIEDYTKAIELTGAYSKAHVNRGHCWQMKKNFDRAIADYNNAIEINPNEAFAYVNRGICWEEKGQNGSAIFDFDKALEIDSNNDLAYYNRSIIWFNEGNVDKAMSDIKKSVQINPDNSSYTEFMEFLEIQKGVKSNEYWTLTFPDGSKYKGECKNERLHGWGVYTFSNGDKYVGQFRDDQIHGHGTRTFSNGAKYEGEFKDGKMHGQGVYSYSDGDKYVGEFKNGKMHGQGTYTFPDGAKYEGQWINGAFVD